MQILIENLQTKEEVTDKLENLIKIAIEQSLKLEDFDTPSEVGVLLVDDVRIREINLEQRNIDRSTDVLSFPMIEMFEGRIISKEGDFDMDENLLLLGDIVISLETARRQSEEYGHSYEREVAFLVTHGMFHLLGYDHEETEQERRMFEKQEITLSQLGLKR